ncbi:MAG: hypothetical protein CVU85_00775 [Firmicutes bacterium HGW-Firmicutes-10]|nr:MAG: hypothetical protein CVU85_00775 [Firmicutes bacterium HGW-Firmicutes-10]
MLWENEDEREVMFIDQIKAYCKHFKPLFEHEKHARVHSVYKSTINCMVDDRIFSLQHQEMPITPLSINLDIPKKVFELIRVNRGDEVQFTKEGLMAFNSMFTREHAEVFDCDLTEGTKPLEKVKIKLLTDHILKYIEKGEFGRIAKSFKDNEVIPLSFAGNYVSGVLLRLASSSNVVETGSLSAQLVGVGEGLTPSGDDFNCGMLAAQYYLRGNEYADALKDQLITQISQRINTTTIISKEFLVYACQGKFSQMVKNVLIKSQKEIDVTEEIIKIRDIGHTSGIDFLTGLYFGLLKGGNE